MKISWRSIEALQKIITNDDGSEIYQYRSGSQLVNFFNNFKKKEQWDTYPGQGFPARCDYCQCCIKYFNDTCQLSKIIEAAIGSNDYPVHKTPIEVQSAIQERINWYNQFLEKDGYRLQKKGNVYKVTQQHSNMLLHDALNVLSHDFISEQISKAKGKLEEGDYDGAITNARSLIEAVLKEIFLKKNKNISTCDGNLLIQYKNVGRLLNLDPSNKDISDTLKQVLSGLFGIVSGLSGISNKMGDRHVRSYKPSDYHAKLVVNASFTFCEFLLDSYEHQKNKSISINGL